MKIADVFETKVEEKIEPVIKVGERSDETKLAVGFINSTPGPIPKSPSPIPTVWQYGYGYHDAAGKRVNFSPLP